MCFVPHSSFFFSSFFFSAFFCVLEIRRKIQLRRTEGGADWPKVGVFKILVSPSYKERTVAKFTLRDCNVSKCYRAKTQHNAAGKVGLLRPPSTRKREIEKQGGNFRPILMAPVRNDPCGEMPAKRNAGLNWPPPAERLGNRKAEMEGGGNGRTPNSQSREELAKCETQFFGSDIAKI